jgi:hypothetical protein
MKYLASLALLCGFVAAQPAPSALPAELSVPFGVAPGQIVMHTSYLLFVDTEQPAGSFALQRSEVSAFTREAAMVSITSTAAVRSRGGEANRLNLRFTTPEAASQMEMWFRTASPAMSPTTSNAARPNSISPAAADATPFQSYTVAEKRKIGRDSMGKLLFTNDKIIFEAINDLDRSRQWAWRDVKEMKRESPYRLRITPFTGDSFNFELSGNPMDNAQYNDLVDRVTRARTTKP